MKCDNSNSTTAFHDENLHSVKKVQTISQTAEHHGLGKISTVQNWYIMADENARQMRRRTLLTQLQELDAENRDLATELQSSTRGVAEPGLTAESKQLENRIFREVSGIHETVLKLNEKLGEKTHTAPAKVTDVAVLQRMVEQRDKRIKDLEVQIQTMIAEGQNLTIEPQPSVPKPRTLIDYPFPDSSV